MTEEHALKGMEDALANVLQTTGSGAPLARVPRTEPSLPDQIAQYERISRTLAEKIRKEQVAIRNDYQLKWVEVNTTYAAHISEAVAKLEKERDNELLSLTETTSRKLHDLEQLARRSG